MRDGSSGGWESPTETAPLSMHAPEIQTVTPTRFLPKKETSNTPSQADALDHRDAHSAQSLCPALCVHVLNESLKDDSWGLAYVRGHWYRWEGVWPLMRLVLLNYQALPL